MRDFDDSDWRQVHEYASDEQVARYMEWGPNTESESRNFVRLAVGFKREKPRRQYELAMVHKADKKIIGGCGLTIVDKDGRQAALGYVLGSRYWMQGLTSEAALALIRFGFEALTLHRIIATCDELNEGSAAVMKKCGMRKEAHFLKERFVKGYWRNTYLYAILADEWLEKNQEEQAK